jgi:ubiquinone/menaquinone biosynthesis C-methylase UbiE
MILNAIERALVNNPLRALSQRHLEARLLERMGGRVDGGRVLEIGCGRGIGTEIVLDRFGAGRVDAFDLDARMVDAARARLARHGDRVRLWVGDVEHIDAPDGHYDAVFDFAILHHVPDWRAALREIHRVLRPDGRLFVEEVMAAFILHPLWRRVLDHPLEDRFDAPMLGEALARTGFDVLDTRRLGSWFAWLVATRT